MKSAYLTALLAICLLFSSAQRAFAQNTADSKAQIEALVDKFQQAIINKDKAGFLSLLLREDISWIPVYTDGSIARYNATLTAASAPRRAKVQSGSPRKFIESIANAKEARAEAIANLRIETDGDIAQVWFDYTFMLGDYKGNWGKESWQLVRTDTGWKIASVVWSTEQNPLPR